MILHDSRFSCMARGVLRLVPYRGNRLGFYICITKEDRQPGETDLHVFRVRTYNSVLRQ